MSAKTTTNPEPTPAKRNPGPRKTHLVYTDNPDGLIVNIRPFGQELDALRWVAANPGTKYVALPFGEEFPVTA